MPRMTKVEKAAEKAKREARIAGVNAIIATGKCPRCGSPLRRNLALTGWWQCSQYGAVGFRADSAKDPCDWQDFNA